MKFILNAWPHTVMGRFLLAKLNIHVTVMDNFLLARMTIETRSTIIRSTIHVVSSWNVQSTGDIERMLERSFRNKVSKTISDVDPFGFSTTMFFENVTFLWSKTRIFMTSISWATQSDYILFKSLKSSCQIHQKINGFVKW